MDVKRRIGACTSTPDEVRILAKYGYHFFEAHFRLLREMSEPEFQTLADAVTETGLRAEGTNCFADPPMSLLESGLDELDEYLKSSLGRPKRLGAKYIVIGSGASRMIPEGMSYEAATQKFVAMLKRYGEIAEKNDVDIVVEPLFGKATNFITTFEEALNICRATDHPRVGCLMDFFHSYQEGEPFSVMEKAGAYLKHIHISALDRRVPGSGDIDEIKRLIESLDAIHYTGRVTLEGAVQHDFEAEMREFSTLFPLFESWRHGGF